MAMTPHPVPDKALESHVGVVGKTGSGKTYLVRTLIERMLEKKQRTCIVDPTDVAWGVRLDTTGKKPSGYDVVIFGGNHGDMPLGEKHGAAMAEIVGTGSTPVIISTKLMTVGARTRFFCDFAEQLLIKNQGPLNLIIDEAHLFAPKGKVNSINAGEMISATNNLVSLGRSGGFNITLITQRPAKLHNDCLSCVETLIAMRLILPADQDAVEDWMGSHADKRVGQQIMDSLPKMKTGTGWIYAPEMDILKQAEFPLIKTFDSMKPLPRGKVGPKLKPIDLKTVSTRLEQITVEIKQNDPETLKARIRVLEAAAKKVNPASPAIDITAHIKAATVAGHTAGYADAVTALCASFKMPIDKIRDLSDACRLELDRFRSGATKVKGTKNDRALDKAASAIGVRRREAVTPILAPPNGKHVDNDSTMPKGERKILVALAQNHTGCAREQLSILTGFKRSTRDLYLQRLRQKGYVSDDEQILITDEGCAALGAYEPLPTGAALLTYWLGKLPQGEREVLKVVSGTYPDALDRDSISDQTNYKRSTRDLYLQRLNTRKLIVAEGGGIKAAEELFD